MGQQEINMRSAQEYMKSKQGKKEMAETDAQIKRNQQKEIKRLKSERASNLESAVKFDKANSGNKESPYTKKQRDKAIAANEELKKYKKGGKVTAKKKPAVKGKKK